MRVTAAAKIIPAGTPNAIVLFRAQGDYPPRCVKTAANPRWDSSTRVEVEDHAPDVVSLEQNVVIVVIDRGVDATATIADRSSAEDDETHASSVLSWAVTEQFGPYRVCEELGLGGMATVHRAEIDIAGAVYEVALKRLDPELARDRTYVRRFIAEARLGQLLRHPNIVRTHEVGSIDGTHFIAFEWIPGVTMLQIFELARETSPPAPAITTRVITQAARAVAYAHDLHDEQGRPVQLIHRDIAPSNIILGDDGVSKLIDFGVAKSTLTHVNTVAGEVIGKLGYVAPEYLETGKCDIRADIYALGVIAWELLTGHRLFEAETLDEAESQRAVACSPPSALNPRVPEELDRIVQRALSNDVGQRWQTAGELADALEQFTEQAGMTLSDAEVSRWVMSEFGEPARRKVRARTADIESDVELDIERTFARVRLRTEPIK